MSKMIPQQTVDAYRKVNDIVVSNFGITCELFIPTNIDNVQPRDMYSTWKDLLFEQYETDVVIFWSPNQAHLRKLGVFTEGELPILAYFKNLGREVTLKSYIRVPLQFIPKQYDHEEFEVVDVIVKHIHDAEIIKVFKLAPRRVPEA